MTHFDKINKGLININQINCYMNVCLQSLISCPAFFNMISAIAKYIGSFNEENSEGHRFINKEFLLKYAELSKYFNPNIQLELEKTDIDFKMYTRKSFDASLIFYKDL